LNVFQIYTIFMRRNVLLLGICLWMFTAASAQVSPPELTCFRNDSLFWKLPMNDCGPFKSYQIFASKRIDGSYSLLAEISDSTQQSYEHLFSGTATWYYYMVSQYDCPNEVTFSSDTISNEPPKEPVLKFVSVLENNLVTIAWEGSDNPNTIYSIYKNTTTGTDLIATIDDNANFFIDNNANPNDSSVKYTITLQDNCGNTSAPSAFHQTIFLTVDNNPCLSYVNLRWNPYRNWEGGVDYYEIWLGEDGGLPVLAYDSIPKTDSTFQIRMLDKSKEYCAYVVAKQRFKTNISRSNSACFVPNFNTVSNFLAITDITVTQDSAVELRWFWDSLSNITAYTLERSEDNANFITIYSEAVGTALPGSITYKDMDAAASERPYYYRVRTINACDSTEYSNVAATIFLSVADQRENSNTFLWTPYDLEFETRRQYELRRTLNNRVVRIFLGSQDSIYTDAIVLTDEGKTEICYQVFVKVAFKLDSKIVETTSYSNSICITQFATVLLPNAFAPSGRNQTFKPLFRDKNIQNYQMMIYDRWGQLLFESIQVGEGWDGKNKEGEAQKTGVYTYVISFNESEGILIEKKGTVFLMR